MRTLHAFSFTLLSLLSGCSSVFMSDTSNMVTAFAPQIEKDGTRTFTFIANKNFPTYGSGASYTEIHEKLISSELGKRQYCMEGYEIVSSQEVSGGNIFYTGRCK